MAAVERLRAGERAVEVSAATSVVLLSSIGAAGLLSGSVALMASALDKLMDIVGMAASWVGFRISRRKPDSRFNYGYYKAESLAMLFISVLIIYAAIALLLRGYSSLWTAPSLEMAWLALPVALASVFISLLLSRFLRREGKKINSDLLVATSRERLSDVASAAAVFTGITMSFLGIKYVEGLVSIGMALLVFRMGAVTVRDSAFALMDISPSREKDSGISGIICRTRGVDGFDRLRLRKAGPFVFGEATIKVSRLTNVARAHEIADGLERKIGRKMPEMVSFVVHVEPYSGARRKIAIPLAEDAGLESALEGDFGVARYFMLADTENRRIMSFRVFRNPHTGKKAGFHAFRFIRKKKVDVLVVRKIKEAPYHSLRDHMVEIYDARGKNAGDVIKRFIDNRLPPLGDHSGHQRAMRR